MTRSKMMALTAIPCLFSAVVLAAPVDTETTAQTFSVRLGVTRVIYDPDSNGTTLSVVNPQDYPILLQSEALTEDMKSRAPFMVTPPLQRIEALQQSRLRIVRTGGSFPPDRESMQWICAKGIPPKAGDTWAAGRDGKPAVKDKVFMNVQLSINSCIKLFVRPAAVKGSPTDAARQVAWQWQGGRLKGSNNSPFYINLTSLTVNGSALPDAHYIPPFGSYVYDVPDGKKSGQVNWKIINDYGGESPVFRAEPR